MLSKNNNQKGFTLMEMLVVISIIGLLSSFAVVSLNSARMKARDAIRKADMAQLRTALIMYYDDNLVYPVCDDSNWNPSLNNYGSSEINGTNCFNGLLTTALTGGSTPIMSELPTDPRNIDNDPIVDLLYNYRYISNTSGQQYALVYSLEESPGVLQVNRGY